jgi:hypothetical protein
VLHINLPVYTRNTTVWVHGVLRCAKIPYRSFTMGFTVPVRNPMWHHERGKMEDVFMIGRGSLNFGAWDFACVFLHAIQIEPINVFDALTMRSVLSMHFALEVCTPKKAIGIDVLFSLPNLQH